MDITLFALCLGLFLGVFGMGAMMDHSFRGSKTYRLEWLRARKQRDTLYVVALGVFLVTSLLMGLLIVALPGGDNLMFWVGAAAVYVLLTVFVAGGIIKMTQRQRPRPASLTAPTPAPKPKPKNPPPATPASP